MIIIPNSYKNYNSSTFYWDTYNIDFSKILLTLVVAIFLCILLFLLSYFFSFSNKKDYEKSSEYECGFEPFDSATRQPFDVHFYIVGILFLIFDVEIALLFPWANGLGNITNVGYWMMALFLTLLTIGFVYEWKRGALAWPHPTIAFENNVFLLFFICLSNSYFILSIVCLFTLYLILSSIKPYSLIKYYIIQDD